MGNGSEGGGENKMGLGTKHGIGALVLNQSEEEGLQRAQSDET